jgi:hypothetical protein
MLKTVNWRKLGYPKHPIPKYTAGYDRVVWEWYRDHGFAVPHNGAEYKELLAGRGVQLSKVKVRYRPNQPKPSDIPKNTPGYDKIRRTFRQLDSLFPLPPIIINKEYYVYEYLHPVDNTCFYVGYGKGNRWHDINARSDEFSIVLTALGRKGLVPTVVKIYENLSIWLDGVLYMRDVNGIWQRITP